jgi:hypothetical protein
VVLVRPRRYGQEVLIRPTSRIGGAPNLHLYSRPKCAGSSYLTWYPALAAAAIPASSRPVARSAAQIERLNDLAT